MTIRYAVVQKTPCHIDFNKPEEAIKEDIEELLDDEDIVTFHTLESEEEFLLAIKKHINPDSGMVTGTKTFIGDVLYQTIFEELSNVVEHSVESLNKLGCQFSDGRKTSKPIIVIKNKILEDDKVSFDNITMTDLDSILRSKFFKKGVIYKENGAQEPYTYSQNHLDNIMLRYGEDFVNKNFQYDELEFGDMIFIVAFNKNAGYINKRMTKIVGQDVYGDAYCSLYYKTDHIKAASYISMSVEMFSKIAYLLENKNFCSQDYHENVTKDNIEDIAKKDTSQKVVSPWSLVDRIYNKYNKGIESKKSKK